MQNKIQYCTPVVGWRWRQATPQELREGVRGGGAVGPGGRRTQCQMAKNAAKWKEKKLRAEVVL